MRQDYDQLAARDAEVLAIGPDGPAELRRYWDEQGIPFVGLADPSHEVADLYGQEVKLLKLGRMPSLLVVDREGAIRYAHYGDSMADTPESAEVLAVLDGLHTA